MLRGPAALEVLEGRSLLSGLSLALATHSIAANAGPAATTGTLTRTGADNAAPLSVSLSSGNPGSAAVPATVVIPAGQASATFNVDAPTGNASPANQSVTISGTASAEALLAHDTTFKSSGQSFGTAAVAVQPDGKVVAVGAYFTGNSQNYDDFAVERYNADGSVDTTFNGGAQVLTGVSGQLMKAEAVALQADGKIVVGGVYAPAGSSHYNFILARYSPDGVLDPTFGSGGLVTLVPTSGYYNEIWSLAVQPDGKVLVGGDVDNGSPTYDDFAVARLNADGSLDTGFGSAGIAETSFSNGSDRGFALALQGDGKVVLAGTSFDGNSTSHFAVARFTAGGQLDPTFGGGSGRVQTDIPGDFEEAKGVALQADGKIVVAGYVDNAGVYPPTANNFALARYNADGSPDTGFGTAGVVVRDFGGNDQASAVAVEPDGLIVVAGQGGAGGSPLVARFLPNGGFDASASWYGYPIAALALQPGGRVIVAGSSPSTVNTGFVDAATGLAAVGGSDTLTVTGTAVPTAVNDSFGVTKSTALAVAAPGVLANDSDPNGLPLSATLVSGPSHGSVVLNADGSFTYTPAGAYLGADSFTYKANDGQYDSNVATVSLAVTGSDDPPVAGNDSYTLFSSGNPPSLFRVNSPGVLVNDSDPNGQPITASLVAGPAHGTLALNADGSFSYTPAANFFGTDSFTYQASDGTLASNVATVSIAVYGSPVAVADSYTTAENTPLAVGAPGVLANDSDPNGLALTPVVTGYPANGTLSVHADGSFSYVPKANFHGTDSFNYHVTDGKYSSGYVTDTINVTFVDQPPVANDDSYTLSENGSLTTAAGATSLQMASQPGDWVGGGQNYSYTPSDGTFTASHSANDNYVEIAFHTPNYSHSWDAEFAAPNNAPLTPGTYLGATRYPFQASTVPGLNVSGDGRGSNTLTGQFTVIQAAYDSGGNVLAFAASFVQHSEGATPALTGTVEYNSSLGQPEGVLFNDTDPDAGQTLSAALVAGPSHGSVTLNPNGSFSYTPAPEYDGTDSFTYKANDGQLDSNVATVHLTVTPVNDAPTANADRYVARMGAPLSIPAATGVLANDSDEENDPLTAALVAQPADGSVALNPDGSFTYTPNAGYHGADSFTYRANDGQHDSNVATVALVVDAPPVAADQSLSTGEGMAVAVTLSASDPDNDPLTYTVVAAPAHGTLGGTAPNLTYTPAPGYDGADSFTFEASDGMFESAVATVSLTVNPPPKVDPTITWPTPTDITYGTALGAAQLDASASVAGTFSYTPALGTVLSAGAGQSLQATFTPTDPKHYNSVTASTTINVSKATPTITWPTPADIVYGTPLGASQLDASASVAGTFSYTPATGTVLGAGQSQVLSTTFTPSDPADFSSVTASTTINVAKATPAITWPAPAGITYGTPLGASQLDASASVPGTFSYSPASGTVLGAGSQALSATFTPIDLRDYNVAKASTAINVAKATPTMKWASPASITYGTPLGAAQLDASASVPGTFSYAPASGTVLGAGSQTLSATFTPTDLKDYNVAQASTAINVAKATPTITWPTPADIAYGTPLGTSQLDASAPVAGTFSYAPASGTVLGIGQSQALSATFTPTDLNDYNSATASTTINVAKATPAITWPAPAGIVYGTPLGSSQLDASSPIAGYYTYTPAGGTILGAGLGQSLSVTFTPIDLRHYNTTKASTTINVAKATPTITWPSPADITYGTPLGAAQLDASASVPGTFSYTPASGTVLGAGSQTLSATFTPTDLKDYNVAQASTAINVAKATPTITWPAPAGIVYGTPLGSSQLDASASIPGAFSYSLASGTVLRAGQSQALSATFTPSDLKDYNVAKASTAINVAKATPKITWPSPAGITYGTPLGTAQLDASASVPGTFSYTPASGTVLGAGSQTLSVSFAPADPADYNVAKASTTINVAKATPTMKWASPASITYGTPLGAAQLDASASVPGTFSYTPASGTVLGAGSQMLSATYTPTDLKDYNVATAKSTLVVSKAHLTVTAANQDMGHGDAVPAPSYTLSGFVNGDTARAVGGAPSLSTSATGASPAGIYPITATTGTLSAANYDFAFAPGKLTVHPKVLDVRAHWGNRSMSLVGLGRDLPFLDINAIDVVFSDDVTVGVGDLSLTSTVGSGRSYGFGGFSYNASGHDATWTLPTALGIDRLLLALDAKFGARANPSIAVWNTTPLKFNVLPGDFNGDGLVTSNDVTGVGGAISVPTAWADLDGNGVVDQNDVNAAKRRLGTHLP